MPSPPSPQGQKESELALWPLFMRTPIQFLRAPPSWSVTPQRSHLQIAIPQGFDFNTGICGGGGGCHKHSDYNVDKSPIISPSFYLEVARRTSVCISLDEAPLQSSHAYFGREWRIVILLHACKTGCQNPGVRSTNALGPSKWHFPSCTGSSLKVGTPSHRPPNPHLQPNTWHMVDCQ